MGKNKKIIISAVSVLALLLNLFLPAAAWAYTLSLPSLMNPGSVNIDVNDILQEVNTTGISSVSSQLEDRYGLNKDIWTTAQRKTNAPKVTISFDNTNPKVGEKVTANAIPEYFKNEPQNLYYTWYIIHTTDGTPKTATNSIESGKKEAAKIMARGDYDPDLDGQDYTGASSDPDKDGWPLVDSGSYDSGKDQAPMGGADGVGGLAKDSDNLDPSLSAYCSPKSKSSQCNLYTTTDSFSSYYKFSGTQSDSYCSACSSQTLSWGTLSSNNQCCYLIANPTDTEYLSYDSATAYCPTAYDSAYESCFDYASLKTTNQSAIESCLYTECADDYDTTHSSSTVSGDNGNDFSRCFKRNFGTSSNASGYQGYEGSSGSYGNDNSGLDYNVTCKHKWENATGYTSGSGKFTTGEEEYWKTDPTDPDTDGDGFVDGADVIGLGQQNFTWTYQSGDRVGVVVEGTSMIPTDEKTAYYKIMWGYLDVCDSTKNGLLDNDQCDDSGDYGYGFLATKAPGEEGEGKLQLSLSYTPSDPIADSTTENSDNVSTDGTISDADKITVTSSLNSADLDADNLYYTWQIQKGTLGDDESWKELDTGDDFETDTVSSGLGLSSFSFTPKTSSMKSSNDIVYFKVTVTASRSSGVTSKRGRASTVIPVNKKGVKIKFYKVDIKDGKATRGDEVCSTGTYCYVVPNQMLAAKVASSSYTKSTSDFAWTVNGENYPTPSDVSDSFDGWDDATTYFAIIENEGDTPAVTLTATPNNSLAPVTVTRYLYVASPSASITSADSGTSWGKVSTVDDTETMHSTTTATSKTSFEAATDSEVSYSLNLVPSYLYDDTANTSIDWKISGTSINDTDFSEDDLGISGVTTENNDKTLKFTTGSTDGSYYTIEADVKKYWSADEKSILDTAWGVTPETIESTASIDASTITAEDTTSAAPGDTGQILAAIGTHLPHYFMYLLRLALTMAVMFVVSAGFYGLTQRLSLSDEEK